MTRCSSCVIAGMRSWCPPRVLKMLLHLLRNRSRAVSRDELVEVVWDGLAVSDAALSQTIMLARKATRDEGDQQAIIKMVRGHGFRFVAPVNEIDAARRLFDALARVLGRVARALHQSAADGGGAPAVVLALDDLHAADDASIHFLRFLSADLRAASLLVVGTFRDLEVTRPGALARLLGGPLENTLQLALDGLELPEVAQLLHLPLSGSAECTGTFERAKLALCPGPH